MDQLCVPSLYFVWETLFLNICIPNLSENVIGAISTYSMGLKALRSLIKLSLMPYFLGASSELPAIFCGPQTMVKSFEVTELLVRSAKFIACKQWVVAGADDMYIRVYNYNTMDKVKVFEAYTDYIRCVAIRPTLPYVLSSSDDMLIKLWDWEKGWVLTFNPKDTNTFASASLDRTIKTWNLGSPDPNFTLDAHLKWVNCVDYFTGGDKPYLITSSYVHTAKVWDYQTKSCVQTLDGHTHNVSAVCFHLELPIVITGFEDVLRISSALTFPELLHYVDACCNLDGIEVLENTLNYGLEKVCAIGYMKGLRR
ncbi:Coatomer subunit beta'-2 [Camellia lanceoleosa]|uniref:Coatomer subunit beta'-2 n=1 Tax=Camellia lanceoleosa TaxID=1840588 RepID=A0ACC0GWI3_9ERIC|nr:Coatomer subunit beta'-2 [Camellia lanceoleosa]